MLRTFLRLALCFHLLIDILTIAVVWRWDTMWAERWCNSALPNFLLVRVTLCKDPVATEMLNLYTAQSLGTVRRGLQTVAVGLGFGYV